MTKQKEKDMKEIKEGSKVKSLFNTGPLVGLEGEVLSVNRVNSHTVMVEVEPSDKEKFPEDAYFMLDYQLQCLDPEKEELEEPRFGIEDLDGLYTKALDGCTGRGPKLQADESSRVLHAVNNLHEVDPMLGKLIAIKDILMSEFSRGVRCSVCGRTDGGDDCARNC